MSKSNGRIKGKRGELECAKILGDLLGVKLRRGQQFSGLGGEDVVGLEGIHIEVKRKERLAIYEAIDQSVKDCTDDQVPIVCHRKNNREWLVTFRMEDIQKLIDALLKNIPLTVDEFTGSLSDL